MSYFERKPEEKKNSIAEPLAKYEHGQFSVTEEEKKRKVKEAIAKGRNPEEALRKHEKRLAQANARLMEERKEKGL